MKQFLYIAGIVNNRKSGSSTQRIFTYLFINLYIFFFSEFFRAFRGSKSVYFRGKKSASWLFAKISQRQKLRLPVYSSENKPISGPARLNIEISGSVVYTNQIKSFFFFLLIKNGGIQIPPPPKFPCDRVSRFLIRTLQPISLFTEMRHVTLTASDR